MKNISRDLILFHLESVEPFPIDLDDVWEAVGYSRKDNAVRVLLNSGFDQSKDIRFEAGINKHQGNKYYLSVDCFKMFCMMANTEMGRKVRMYYLDQEAELKAMKESMLNDLQSKIAGQNLSDAVVEEFRGLFQCFPIQAIQAIEAMNLIAGLPQNTSNVNANMKEMMDLLELSSKSANRAGLALNKQINAEKQNAAYTDPTKVSQMREEIIRLSAENAELTQKLIDGNVHTFQVNLDNYVHISQHKTTVEMLNEQNQNLRQELQDQKAEHIDTLAKQNGRFHGEKTRLIVENVGLKSQVEAFKAYFTTRDSSYLNNI